MSKSSKNIVAILVIFVMVICLFFTLKAMKPASVKPSNFDTSKIEFKDKNSTDKKERPSRPSDRNRDKSDETEESNSTEETNKSTEDNSVSETSKTDTTKREFNFDRNDFGFERKSSNTIYYILYFLESATIGGCAVFLVYNNKKEDKKTK